MNGKQFMAMIKAHTNGKPTPINTFRRRKTLTMMRGKYFFGEAVEDKINGVISIRSKMADSRYVCMKCGKAMSNKINQHIRRGKWIGMRRINNKPNWSCRSCFPGGNAPLVVSCCIIEA